MNYRSLLLLLIFACQPVKEHSSNGSELQQQEITAWDADARLEELGIALPEISNPIANYVHVVRSGNLLFLAGKGPQLPEGGYILGKVGKDLSIDEGKEAARLTAIAQLAVLKAELGSLNKVKQIVKVLGMVHCEDDFTQHPQVINGFSDLMVGVFGEKGKHARSAVGMNSLPLGFAVEIELIVEIED
ncbi:MAG: RidA family protein [Mongoliitalea sp.]